jgi:hypothetical protein
MSTLRVRFLNGLKDAGGNSWLYIDFQSEGWYVLSQFCEVFFPHWDERAITLKIWTAKNIPASTFYGTELASVVLLRIRDKALKQVLIKAGQRGQWLIDLHSAEKLLKMLNPTVPAGQVVQFMRINHRLLKKGGRKRAITNRERLKVAAAQDWLCARCQKTFGPELTFEVDHKISWAEGGTNHHINLQALCPNCHAEKTHQDRDKVFRPFCYGPCCSQTCMPL